MRGKTVLNKVFRKDRASGKFIELTNEELKSKGIKGHVAVKKAKKPKGDQGGQE